MAEPFQFDWTTAVPVDDEPRPSAPSTPTPPESVDAVMSATSFGAQNMPQPQQGPVDAYGEFDWKTAEPLDGGFDPSTAREATPAENAEFYEQVNSTAYLPTKDEWRWRENFRKQRDDKVTRFIEGGKAMAGGLVQAAAATAFAPFDFLRRGTVAYDEWVNSSAEGVRQTGIATAELWSWAGDVIADRGKEIERNAALDAKLRQQLASENRFTGNAETDGQVFLQAREAARASGFYDKTPEELTEDEDTQYQRFIRDRSFQQQAENITETNIGTLPDGRAEMGIDESKLNPGLVTTTQLIADPLNIAAGGLGIFSKLRPLRRVAALAGKPLELGGKAAGAAAQKADELYAGVVNVIENNTGLTGAQQMSALQNPITWKAAAAMGTLKGAGGILRTGQTWMDTGSVFVREAGTGGVGVARVEAAGKLRAAPIPERYRRAYDGFFTSADSTLRRVSETPGLSPVARRSAATLDRIGATQAFRVADDAIGGALATTPIAVPLAAISPEERQSEMLGALMTVGAVGGVVGGKVRRVAESDDALVAKMLADVEISGGDATSMANMLSHEKLLRMAQMQTVMSAKADFVPLRANDYELNPTVTEHMGKNSRGFYVDTTKGQRPRVFVNLDKLAAGDVVGHEIGHAILKSDILGGQIKQGMRSVVDAQYGADGIASRGREYVKAQLTQEVNHKATGIEIEVLTPEESQRKAAGVSMDELVADRWKNDPAWRDQQISERVDLLNQEALGKGEISLDWARDEIAAETFSGLGKGINVAGLRASGPMGRTLGAMQTGMETMGARFTGSGRLESPNQLFTENPLFDTPQMRKAVNNYVKLYDRYLVGLEKEGKVKQRGRPIAPTGRPEEAARSPHTRTYDNNGVLESELFIERPDGTRVPKSQQMIDTQEKARAATLKSINNRTRFVDENSSEWGARRLSNGRVEVGGPNLPPQFDYFVQVPQWLRTKAREFEAGRAEGRSYLYSNNAIGTRGSGRYKIKNLGNVEAKTGEMVPFGWAISTENHLLVKNIDLNSFRAATMRAIDKGQLGEFGNNLRTVEAGLKQLMRNHEEGRPGETGLGVTKKNILNGLLGTGTVTQRLNNQAWHTLNNQGSIRTFRFDRLNYADQFDTGYFPHYQKININALPDDAGRMSLNDFMRFDADRQAAWLNNRARERGYTNSTNWANSDEAGFAAASDEYRKLFPRPDNNNRMPSALPQAGMAMPDAASTERVTSYHLTDDPNFSLKKAKRPQNNTTLGGDWPNAGIFVGPSAEAWFNGYDYVRPFVVELSHPPIRDMGSKAMDVAGYGGEQFIPAEAFDSVRVERVIPYDEYAREQFGEYGPIESYNEIDAQGRALPQITGSFGGRDTAPLKNYKYSGKDVRNMSPAQQRALAERTEKYARGERPQLFADEQTATSRTRGQAMPDVAPTLENFDAAQQATGGTLRPIADQPENAPIAGRLTPEQSASIDELNEYYRSVTPQRAKELQADAVESLASRLINKGIPVTEANDMAKATFRTLRSRVNGAMQVISGMGTSDLSRMAGTGRPAVATRKGVNPNWLTSAFEAFDTDNDLALMKAQQVARQLNKEQQAQVAAGQSVDAARASGVRSATIDQGMQFVVGEKTADQKAFGSSLREDPSAPPRVYASVVEGQKFGSQGNYNVFFEWKKDAPMVVTSHHHYGVGNGLTDIHASANIGDKNARSFGDPQAEVYDTLPSGKKVLRTRLLVGNAGAADIRAHQLMVSIPESALSGIKKKGAAGARAELNRIAISQLVGSASQGKTQSFTSKDGVAPMVAIQRNRTEAYVLNPDLKNVASITIVSNSPKETALIKKNLANAFKNNGSPLPRIKVVSAESGPSGNPGRKKITDEFFNLTGKVVYGAALGGAAALAAEESQQ